MSINNEIIRLKRAKQNLADWLVSKGVIVAVTATLDDLVALLDSVPSGGGGEVVEATINNYLTTSVTATGPSGKTTIRSKATGLVSTPKGGLIVVNVSFKNVTVTGGTLLTTSGTIMYIRVDSASCQVYCSTSAIM